MGKGSSKEVGSSLSASSAPLPQEDVSVLIVEDASVTAFSFPTTRLDFVVRARLSRLNVLRDGAEIMRKLASCPRLESLRIESWQPDFESFFDSLSPSSSLSVLQLSCHVPLERLREQTALLQRLKKLRLSSTEMRTPELHSLVSVMSDAGCAVQVLNLSNNELENDAVLILEPLLKHLKKLDLSR